MDQRDTYVTQRLRLRRERRIRIILFLAIVLLLLVPPFMYWRHFGDAQLGDQSTWGQFGDFIGGVANPAVALFALFALFQSINTQREELVETREELRRTSSAAERQTEHFAKQAKLEDLSKAATMLQRSIDAALSAKMQVGVARRRGDPEPVVFTASLEDTLAWSLALANAEREPPPHDAQNAQHVAEMLLAKSARTPPEIWIQGQNVIDLLGALTTVLRSYRALEPDAALPVAYRARYGPIAEALRLATMLDPEQSRAVAEEFDATPPQEGMPTQTA